MRTILLLFALSVSGLSLERPGIEYKIFQFPADKIPRIDGDPADWSIVPETYSIGMDQLKETTKGRDFNYDKKDLDVKVRSAGSKASTVCTSFTRPTTITGTSMTIAVTTI